MDCTRIGLVVNRKFLRLNYSRSNMVYSLFKMAFEASKQAKQSFVSQVRLCTHASPKPNKYTRKNFNQWEHLIFNSIQSNSNASDILFANKSEPKSNWTNKRTSERASERPINKLIDVKMVWKGLHFVRPSLICVTQKS